MKKIKEKNAPSEKGSALRQIPAVDAVLGWDEIKPFCETFEHAHLLTVVRDLIDDFRKRLAAGESLKLDDLKKSMRDELGALTSHYYRYAINALGIVLHTGLGRAPYNNDIPETLRAVSTGYSVLQIDDEGKRADRYHKLSRLLQILTGAEAGMMVNNNAGATLLILSALAKDREVIVSRSQLIEIGGAFRIPDVMAMSGAVMREVGTTNRTHLKDYEGVINDRTAALLRVHQSNYRITGFTKEVSLDELVALGKKYSIPVIDDLGSGALVDLAAYKLPREPLVQESVKAGADVICFSGDKLIGGPQCGIIVGRKKYIDLIKKNPLHRALRCCKLTNAALETTLQLFLLKEEQLMKKHRVLSMLVRPLDEIKTHAENCARQLKTLSGHVRIEVRPSKSEVGGGSLSTEELPTYVVALKPEKISVETLARALRTYSTPIFGRIETDQLLLDFRTILEGEEEIIIKALNEILGGEKVGS
ncbi:MAG TPA: L-seryl-tRNA(Sec) selenium transferase [bacterium]